MKGTNIGFVNGKRFREFTESEAGYYDYESRGTAADLAYNDEVQFDTTDPTELAILFFDFARENGLITYVEEVEVEE